MVKQFAMYNNNPYLHDSKSNPEQNIIGNLTITVEEFLKAHLTDISINIIKQALFEQTEIVEEQEMLQFSNLAKSKTETLIHIQNFEVPAVLVTEN